MNYRVIKPFKDFDGSFRLAGETVEADYDRAAKLRASGVIGAAVSEPRRVPGELPVKPAEEKAEPKGKPPVETATRRPRGNTALR